MKMAPNPTEILKLLATTVGRDKIYRAVQYFARFYAWYLYRKGSSKDDVARWNALKDSLATSRKLMRVGKPLEHIQAATNSFGLPDEMLKATAIGRQLGYAGYLTLDMLVWVQKSGFYKFKNIKTINENAQRFWLVGIAFSIISGIYKLRKVHLRLHALERTKRSKQVELQALGNASARSSADADYRVEEKTLDNERHATLYQLLQDALDATIPATSLKYLNLDDGIIGLAGLATSLMGAKTQWKKVNGPK